MKIEILNSNPFCWQKSDKHDEVGLADNCFAAVKFAETSGDEYLREVAGSSFGWIDNQGNEDRDSKFNMLRPTKERIIEELKNYPELLHLALKHRYVRVLD